MVEKALDVVESIILWGMMIAGCLPFIGIVCEIIAYANS